MPTFGHQKLDVYQVAIDFVALADEVAQHLPRGRAYLADQLQRAAVSVPLNIAEGAGEFSRKDKRRFYRMALRSATEAAAILDVCVRLELGEPASVAVGLNLLDRIVAMLTRMIRGQPREESGAGGGAGAGGEPARAR
jgi:four helix bundle protein